MSLSGRSSDNPLDGPSEQTPPVKARIEMAAEVYATESGESRVYRLTCDFPLASYDADFSELLRIVYDAVESTGALHDGAERLVLTIDRGPEASDA